MAITCQCNSSLDRTVRTRLHVPRTASQPLSWPFKRSIPPGLQKARKPQLLVPSVATTTKDRLELAHRVMPNPADQSFYIRRATEADAAAASSLVTEAFASYDEVHLARLPEWLAKFEQKAAGFVQQGLEEHLVTLLTSKRTSARLARERRLLRKIDSMKAELAQLKGETRVVRSSWATPRDLREEARWRRERLAACLLAVDRPTGAVVGTATMSMIVTEALLPPPFPTAKPPRCYLSNMAVDPCFRKRGIARALLQRFETIARRWGQDSVWLHVDANNSNARSLYESCGYTFVRRELLTWPEARLLLRKPLEPLRITTRELVEDPEVMGGSTRTADGVFIWETAPK